MRKLLFAIGLFLSLAASAQVQWTPTGSRTRFGNGIAFSSKDTLAYSQPGDSLVLFMGRDSALKYRFKGNFKSLATTLDLASYKAKSDTGFNGGYTTRERTKQLTDSGFALKKNISDTGFNGGYTTRERTKQQIDSISVASSGIYIPLSQKGANNGVPTLDAGGKVPTSQLPSSLMIYKGTWDASTNTPTLNNAIGIAGWVYQISNYGIGSYFGTLDTFYVGDYIMYNGTEWEVSSSTVTVRSVSVNGSTAQQGVVSITLPNSSVTNGMLAGSIDYSKMNAATVPTWNQNTTGNAATATLAANSTLWNGLSIYLGGTATTIPYMMVYDGTNSRQGLADQSQVRTFLGLGSYAYRSSGLAELTGATFTGALNITNANINLSNSYYLAGKLVSGTNITLIGMNGSDKITIDPNGYGVVIGNTLGLGGALTGTTANFAGFGINATPSSSGTYQSYVRYLSTGADFYIGTESSTGGGFFGGSSAYASVLYSGQPIQSIVSGTKRFEVNSSGISVNGAASISGDVYGVGAVFSSNLYAAQTALNPATNTSSVYSILNTGSGFAGKYIIQAGGGSSGFGGAVNMFGHSHASKPGWVTVGLSSSSGGKFTVNNQGLADGTDVFSVDYTGALVGTSATFSSTYGGGSTNDFLTVSRSGGAVAATLGYDSPNTEMYFGTSTAQGLQVRTGNTTRIHIPASGSGIDFYNPISGTSANFTNDLSAGRLFSNTQSALVQAYSASGTGSATFRAYSGTNYWDWYVGTTSDLLFQYNGTTKFTMSNSGNATLTGALTGTVATFTGDITISKTTPILYLDATGGTNGILYNTGATLRMTNNGGTTPPFVYDLSNGNISIGGTISALGGTFTRPVYTYTGSGSYAASLGGSGGDYGSVGYNVGYTGTSNSYTYVTSDAASFIRFTNGTFQFISAGAGTGGATMTTNNHSSISNTGVFTGTGATLSGALSGTSASFSSSVTASSFIKSGGTSSQLLAADGSVVEADLGVSISGNKIKIGALASSQALNLTGSLDLTTYTTPSGTFGYCIYELGGQTTFNSGSGSFDLVAYWTDAGGTARTKVLQTLSSAGTAAGTPIIIYTSPSTLIKLRIEVTSGSPNWTAGTYISRKVYF